MSILWGWFGLSTLIGAAALVLALFIPEPVARLWPLARHFLFSVAIYAFGFSTIYGLGWHARDEQSREAAMQEQIDKLQRDLGVAVHSSAILADQLTVINTRAAEREKQVSDYEAELQKRKTPRSCLLNDSDLRWLRGTLSK